jgi:hypothetical protein
MLPCGIFDEAGACAVERCPPSSVPLPPQPPRKVALPCSAGSQVATASPTSTARACPRCGLWPSRTGLDRQTKACWRSLGSRACCFSACAGSQTTQDRQPLAICAAAVLPSSYSEWSQHPDLRAFRSPGHSGLPVIQTKWGKNSCKQAEIVNFYGAERLSSRCG